MDVRAVLLRLVLGSALGVALIGAACWVGRIGASSAMIFWAKGREGFALNLLDVDTGLLVRVTQSPPYRPFSPPQLTRDAQRALFEVDRDGERALFLLDARGRLLYEQPRDIAIRQPVWSPDGSAVAYWATTDGFWRFYVMDRDGEQQRILSDTVGLVPYTYPLWSPDGSHILFRIWVAERGSAIFLLDAVTGNTRNISESLSAAGDLVWSPDGSALVFRSERERNGEIYVLDVLNDETRNLTQNPAIDFQPDWSPDGSEIVFVSNREGQGELFRMRSDGAGVIRITHGGGWSPDWSPRGDLIAFISRRSGSETLYVVSPEGGEPRAVARISPEMVFRGWLGEPPRS
jgi:Tol biopolymer transport system component